MANEYDVIEPIVLDKTVREGNDKLVAILNNITKAEEKANEATLKADAASTSATNAAQSYANTDAIAKQLTEYLATKETLTAPAVDKTLLIEGAAADAKVVGETKIDYIESKNIFNYNSTNRKDGVYINGLSGYMGENASYDSVVILVKSGAKLSFNSYFYNCHVSFFSQIPQLKDYDSGQLPNYIDGFANSAMEDYEVPQNAVAMVVSYYIDNKDKQQIEYGSTSTSYVPYKKGISKDLIIDYTFREDEIYTVGENKMFRTIQEAVDAAPDYSTIYVSNGIYNEAVDVVSTGKTLRIVGAMRDKCILTYGGNNYDAPPLEIGSGVVENLTIITTDTQPIEGQNVAYCVHIDWGIEANNSLQFINCNFHSTLAACVGIGLRENFKLSFNNCNFESETAPCVYAHEKQENNVLGQRIELINCSMARTKTQGAVIRLQQSSAYSGSRATILMQRCIAKALLGTGSTNVIEAVNYPGMDYCSGGTGYLGSDIWYIDEMSALNNSALMDS